MRRKCYLQAVYDRRHGCLGNHKRVTHADTQGLDKLNTSFSKTIFARNFNIVGLKVQLDSTKKRQNVAEHEKSGDKARLQQVQNGQKRY